MRGPTRLCLVSRAKVVSRLISNLFACQCKENRRYALRCDFNTAEQCYDCSARVDILVTVKQRANAEAISTGMSGRCTTSEMSAATNLSASILSVDVVASRIGTFGTTSRSAT